MKLPLYTTILMVCLIITGLSCKKKSDNPIANTFGCLVNGMAFLPMAAGVSGREPLNFSYGVESGKHSLIISVENSRSKSSAYIRLFITAAVIKQGEEYTLVKGNPKDDTPYAYYNYSGAKESYGTDYNTNNQSIGKIHLTYLDEKIAS
ncbi:hypothetical protein ACUN24_20620 [Pedobacter sp. WC2501]|uniref:hypothetical protein n=1 Tax=Pedobacter sp. WC2501 TaxID=3461400 RepID=UPI0040462437